MEEQKDLPTLAFKVKKDQSSLKVVLIEFPEWSKAVKNIPVDDLKGVLEDEMKNQ